MGGSPLALLVATVAAVGVLHTIVPDHWAPIAVLARRQGWSRRETARVAAGAGLGHAFSTIAIGLLAFFAGAFAAKRLGHDINLAAGCALVVFGVWSFVAGIRELRGNAQLADRPTALPTRTALMLILGASPCIEVVPAFLAAAPFGVVAFVVLSIVFCVTSIGTYVITCTLSTAGLEQLRIPAFDRYGEVLSGLFVACIGVAFLIWFR